ncbi:MAG: hypothetical protein NVS9B12_03220 [Vulcanimicrobiaceae bacterium]
MNADTPVAIPRANGLNTALNVVIAPKEAFETLRAAPMWGWAFIIASLLAVAGSVLALPSSEHANVGMMQNMLAHSALMANLTDAQKQQMISDAQHPTAIKRIGGLLLVPVFLLIVAAFQAAMLLIGNAVGSGKASYKQLFCSVMNIAVVGAGLYWIVLGLIAMLRGPASFNSPTDIVAAVPGLGYLAGNAGAGLTTFLASINIFSLWATYLIALAMLTVARVSKAVAYSFALLVLLIGAGFPALLTGFFTR